MLLPRTALLARIEAGLKSSPVVALLGPRQCGKTTLARQVAARRRSVFFDLENARDLARLDHPQTTLESLRGLVVLDEIQRRPDLLPLLRVLADRTRLPCRFLILGSASPDLVRNASESLAGRVHFVDMGGFSLREIGPGKQMMLWLRGGFPRSFLARNSATSLQWRDDFIQTFLERDLPAFGLRLPALTMRRFWTMVAHYHGQTWNGAEIGASLGVSHHTTRRYLDVLTGAYMIRQLQPWYQNLAKRQVKSPKIYVRDSGVLHALLSIPDLESLQAHPKLGASWEGFAMEQVLGVAGERDSYFWATHGLAELDLLLFRRGRPWGFEFKYQDAPRMTKSLHVAISDLKLERVWVVYPGKSGYRLHRKVEVIGLGELDRALDRLC